MGDLTFINKIINFIYKNRPNIYKIFEITHFEVSEIHANMIERLYIVFFKDHPK